MMVDMGLDNIFNNERGPRQARIFNSWIEDWESEILRTQYQDNEKRLLQKYNNLRFLDDEYNKTYIIAPKRSLKLPPEVISSILWFGIPSIGGMGIMWTF